MDPTTNMNAAIYGFVTQYTQVYDTEGVFHTLIDAVIEAGRGPHRDDPASHWARSFLADNQARLEVFAKSHPGEWPGRERHWVVGTPEATRAWLSWEYRIASSFELPPLPDPVAAEAEERAIYDETVETGLADLGLRLRELRPGPGPHGFSSVWLGIDGGRMEIRERLGLPVQIHVHDEPSVSGESRSERLIIAGDPEHVGRLVVATVRSLWP